MILLGLIVAYHALEVQVSTAPFHCEHPPEICRTMLMVMTKISTNSVDDDVKLVFQGR